MTTTTMSATRVAELIEHASSEACQVHYEMRPGDEWRHGGRNHNDDRLSAKVVERGDALAVEVTDGNQTEIYDGPWEYSPVVAFVNDWLRDVWANS
jgi:hypothetical protein